jgi:hypothetical protein
MAKPLEVADRSSFDKGQEAKERPRGKCGEKEKGGATQNGGKPAAPGTGTASRT